MANVLIKLRIMGKSPDVDMDKLASSCEEKVKGLDFRIGQKEIEPVAFGLKALILVLIGPERAGGTEPIEKALAGIEGASQIEVVDVRRAFG